MRTYKYPLLKLEPNQIFVFGSNTQGRHGKGAALWAMNNAGANYTQSIGLQGNSYAIITKDLTASFQPSIIKSAIIWQIQMLYMFAIMNPGLDFIISWNTNSNLNGYTPQDMIDMFIKAGYIPSNIIFEEEFAKLIN